MRGLQPFRLDEKLLEAIQFGGIEVEYHVGFMDDRGVDLSEPVIESRNTGVIIGSDGGDQVQWARRVKF
jgi:hypothetical protein